MTIDDAPPRFLTRPDRPRLAYRASQGGDGGPTLVWCGGFRSDMEGGKATHLHAWAEETGHAFLRFDYSGHGASDGAFEDGTIGQWRDDALAVIDAVAPGPVVLVGSSMGGWIALLLALARPRQIAGLILIAPAPDFTDRLMWPSFTEEQRAQMAREGRIILPSPYDPNGDVITKRLIEDGRDHVILDKPPVPYAGPVRILHGQRDDVVPQDLVLELADALESTDVETQLVKAGDHRLSEPADLDRLTRTADALMRQLSASA